MSEEINKAVHKAMGECLGESFTKRRDPFSGSVHLCDQCDGRVSVHADPIPDYCTDLNAAFRFADKLIADEIDPLLLVSSSELGWVASAGGSGPFSDPSPAKAICLAGLKALEHSEQTATRRGVEI
jgi:hypothetical protein